MRTHGHIQAKTGPKPSMTPVRNGLLQRKCACGGTPGADGECASCRAKRLGAQPTATRPAAPTTVPASVNAVLQSGGQPLDPAARAFHPAVVRLGRSARA